MEGGGKQRKKRLSLFGSQVPCPPILWKHLSPSHEQRSQTLGPRETKERTSKAVKTSSLDRVVLLSTPDTAGSGVPGPEAFRPEAVGRLAGAGPPKRRGGGFPSHCCGLRQILLPSAHCYKIPILQTFLVLNLIKNILTTMPRNFEKGLLKLFGFKKKKKNKSNEFDSRTSKFSPVSSAR